VAKAPSSYRIAGITGESYVIGSGEQHLAGIVIDPYIADYPSGAPRRPYLRDIVTNTIIVGGRPDVCQISRMDFPVADIEGPSSTYRALEAHLLNHVKPYSVYPTSYESFLEWIDIGNMLLRGRNLKNSGLFTVAMPMLSPLVMTKGNCDILLEAVKYNFPIVPTVCPMAGATSPYTMVGTLAQSVAECLAVNVILQALNPGNPFLYAVGPSVTDLKDGHNLYYSIDKVLWKLASVELAKNMGLPCAVEMGGATGSEYDMQSGAEGMMMAFSAALSGADILAGAGSCYNANGLSSEFLMIQYAYLDAARYLKRGIPLDMLSDSVDSMAEQGPGGNFLMDGLTLRLMRGSPFYSSPMFDTAGEAGKPKSILLRAHEAVLAAEESFRSPVPNDVREMITRHFNDICARLG
jgi:trimethylamine:corrinoid methyltransferase-like protein